jgi:hypothetical protein
LEEKQLGAVDVHQEKQLGAVDVHQEKQLGAVDVLAVDVHQEKQLGAVDVHQLNSTQLQLAHLHLVQVWCVMKLLFRALPL